MLMRRGRASAFAAIAPAWFVRLVARISGEDDELDSGDGAFDDSGERGALGARTPSKHATSGEWFVLFCS